MSVFAQKNRWTIVLDAGHGGKDPGAVYGDFTEKDINLSVVLMLGALLEGSGDAGIDVVYTRRDDVFVELAVRSRIANRARADLFVSVHVNASANKDASGTETFVMGVDKGNDNLGVAMRENGVISLESDFATTYEGYDPNSTESLIMFTLMQYSYTQESMVLADLMQRHYSTVVGGVNRGVKQAGFLVLWHTSMPSVLTELGFLSNADDRKYLTTKEGHRKLAESLARSILEYVGSNGKVSAQSVSSVKTTKSAEKKQSVKTTARTTAKVSTKQTTKKTTANNNEVSSSYALYGVSVAPSAAPSAAPESYTTTVQKQTGGAHYAVQIRASSTSVRISQENFKGLTPLVQERRIGTLYKYTIGELYDYQDAVALLSRVKTQFADAFIVAFDHLGQSLTVAQAKKIITK